MGMASRGARLVALSWVALGALASPASGQELQDRLPDVANSDYGIDVYLGPVLGSGRIVGMGGAAVAVAEGSAGLLANPAAPGVRSATSRDKWDWDFHVDWLSPQIGDDFDNNGIASTEDATPFLTGGLVGNYKTWALGVSISQFTQATSLTPDDELNTTFTIAQVSLARSFLHDQLVGGLSVRGGTFTLASGPPGNKQRLFEKGGSSVELGAVWKPSPIDIRVGGAVSFPVIGDKLQLQSDDCDPMDCFGFILPERIEVPWRVAGGFAWRRAKTRWNRTVKGEFRDEKSLLLAADLVVTGKVRDGHGIEAFAYKKLQRSGRKAVVSFRGGAEYEWFPGRFRIRGGTYWEPGRFKDDVGETVPGRLHVTLGLELRVYAFRLWGKPYRVRTTLTSDGAENYVNGGLSVGFWH